MQTETIWATPFPQGRASSERFMNDSDNRLNKGEDKSGSIYFLSRAPMIIYHRHSAVLMPLEKHTAAFCWGGAARPQSLSMLRDLRTGVTLWRLGRRTSGEIILFFFFLQTGQFVLESSLPLRVAIYEYNHFNKPIELSYALLTAKQPSNRCAPNRCSLFPPPQPITCIAHKWLGISQQLGRKKKKILSCFSLFW